MCCGNMAEQNVVRQYAALRHIELSGEAIWRAISSGEFVCTADSLSNEAFCQTATYVPLWYGIMAGQYVV